MYNCDETDWSGKEAARGKVVALKGCHVLSQKVMTSDHVTAHLCICADGRFLPSVIIFQVLYLLSIIIDESNIPFYSIVKYQVAL